MYPTLPTIRHRPQVCVGFHKNMCPVFSRQMVPWGEKLPKKPPSSNIITLHWYTKNTQFRILGSGSNGLAFRCGARAASTQMAWRGWVVGRRSNRIWQPFSTSSSEKQPGSGRNVWDELISRGFVHQSTDSGQLRSHLLEKSRVQNIYEILFGEVTKSTNYLPLCVCQTLYVGIDPTADSIHLGNLVPLMAMR